MITFKHPIKYFHESVAVLIFDKNKVLMVSRKNDHTKFTLPGGKVDDWENAEVAARRELLEETGYVVKAPLSVIFESFHTNTEPGKEEHGYWCKTFALTNSFYNEGSVLLKKVQEPEVGGGVVVWNSPEILLEGPCADYNRDLFRVLRETCITTGYQQPFEIPKDPVQ